jgi:ATP-dependent protease ClpP protease subunit
VQPENAQRWVARCVDDANSCQPCIDNNGQTYRNRADAYADYPGGSGYIHCEGQNNCRCTVAKRRGGTNQMSTNSRPASLDVGAVIARSRAADAMFSARALAAPVAAKLGVALPAPDAPKQFAVFNYASGAVTAGSPSPTLAAPANAAQTSGGALYIYDCIGGWDGVTAMDVVMALAEIGQGPIDVHFNSVGGSIFEGSAIHNAIKNYSGGTKTAYIDGVAASAACFIALACDEVVCEPNATMMTHDGTGGVFGTEDDMLDMAAVMGMLSDTIAETIAAKTGQTAAYERDVMRDGDTWTNAAQSVTRGLADRINGVAPAVAPPPPDEDTQDSVAPTQKLDLALFTVDAPVAAPVSPLATIDVAGLREALKGAFA